MINMFTLNIGIHYNTRPNIVPFQYSMWYIKIDTKANDPWETKLYRAVRQAFLTRLAIAGQKGATETLIQISKKSWNRPEHVNYIVA